MTVAYSAYSKKEKLFVMGADDLEGNQNKKVSKIRIAGNRWAFCITGGDNPIFCIDHMLSELPEDEIAKGWPNINEVVGDLAKWTKEYTQNQVRAYGDKEENAKAFAVAKENGCTIVIFDASDFELFNCEMKDLYPPETFDPSSATITKLEDDLLHLHAMAKNRTNQNNKLQIPTDFFNSPKESLENLILLDKQFHDRERAIQGADKVPHIGDLGSYCYIENGQLMYKTFHQ